MFENGLELERAKILRDKLRSIPANIRLGEDVLKTPWRRLQDVFSVTFFCLPRRLEDIIARRLANTSWRRLEDVLEDEKCYAEDVFKTSWRRLGKQEMFAGMLICFRGLRTINSSAVSIHDLDVQEIISKY